MMRGPGPKNVSGSVKHMQRWKTHALGAFFSVFIFIYIFLSTNATIIETNGLACSLQALHEHRNQRNAARREVILSQRNTATDNGGILSSSGTPL